MLNQLGLPAAVYQRRDYEDYKTCVTVIFQPSKLSCEASFLPMTISGVRSMDISVAEHTAAIEAIRYIKNASNTVIKDLNYGRLRQMEKENEVLKNKLKDANIRGEKLARGWFFCVRHMCSFSDQFHNMAILSYFGGQEVITDSMKAAFVNIEGIAQRLKSIGARLETKLEGIRKFAREGNSYQSSDSVFLANNKCVLPVTTDDTNGYCPTPRVVKIPCRLILDAILAAIGYPKARYDFNVDEHAQVSATVTFNSSAHSPGNLIRPIKMASNGANNYAIAEESVARKGIRYMETWEGLDIEDLHYRELGHVRETENDLHDQLQAVEIDKVNLKNELLLAAKKMFSFSHQLSNLAADNHSLGQGDEAEGLNTTHELFQEMASNLGYEALQVQKGATVCTKK